MRKKYLLAFAAMMYMSAALAYAQPLTLAYKFHKGDREDYGLAVDLSFQMDGVPGISGQPMTASVTSTLTQKVLEVLDNSNARVKYFMQAPKIRLSGMGGVKIPNSTGAKPISIVLRMTPKGQVLSIEELQGSAQKLYPGMNTQSFMGQIGVTSMFPPSSVEVGESWYLPIQLPFLNQKLDVCSTLVSDNEMIGGVRAAKIVQTFEGRIDLADIIQWMLPHVRASTRNDRGHAIAQSITGCVDLGGSTDYYISPELGKLLKADGNITLSASMQAPAQLVRQGEPTSVDMSINLRVRLVRL